MGYVGTNFAGKMKASITSIISLLVASLAMTATVTAQSPKALCRGKIRQSLDNLHKSLDSLNIEKKNTPLQENLTEALALADCQELLQLSLDSFTDVYAELSDASQDNETWTFDDAAYFESFASAVQTNAATCLESLAEAGMDSRNYDFTVAMANSSSLTAEALAYMKSVKVAQTTPAEGDGDQRFPSGLPEDDRRRLKQRRNDVADSDVVITVAIDGSGNFSRIGDAINSVANNSAVRTTIRVKAGVYYEYVQVPSYKTNIFLVGDGIDVTVISGNRSVVDGWTTFNSATFAAGGKGFMARDITFENTAGPEKHQAVALRVGSDLSAFYRCSFRGYQDTLYTHSLRQFYRECDIYGTVDFIFGNAAVVLQKCNIIARKPMAGQRNVLTAQGRGDPNQNTGTSVNACRVMADADLDATNGTFKTYLGRPWKEYSRTVFMQTSMDALVDPAGWLEWNGTFALSSLYYGEYNNTGAGLSTDARVSWPGYHVMNSSDALNFTVSNFIVGDAWLSSYRIPYDSALL